MAKRIDANQNEVVKKLRQCGVSVMVISDVGKGCPDLACGFRGQNIFLELKDGDKSPSRRMLTADEVGWHAKWAGQLAVVHNFDEAMNAILGVVGTKTA